MVTHLVASSAILWASTGVVTPAAITHRQWASVSIPVLMVGLIELASVVSSVVKIVAVLTVVVGAKVVDSVVVVVEVAVVVVASVVVVVIAGTFLPLSFVSSSN